MKFIDHSNLTDKHAYLGASKYHWLNYDDNKFIETYRKSQAQQLGTEIHAFAAKCIELGQRLPKSKKTLNMYVNDAISYGMTPEQVLYYSEFAFGTADSITFDGDLLRIHDLKTGTTPAHMEQLLIYTSLFCLEYDIEPRDIDVELRIYQSNAINVFTPALDDIVPVMDKIVYFDDLLRKLKEEEE